MVVAASRLHRGVLLVPQLAMMSRLGREQEEEEGAEPPTLPATPRRRCSMYEVCAKYVYTLVMPAQVLSHVSTGVYGVPGCYFMAILHLYER